MAEAAATAPESVAVQATPLPVVDVVAAALPVVAASVVAASPLTAEPAAPGAPLSRRARRAPAIEASLTPAEPFELLEPVIEDVQPEAEIPAEVEIQPEPEAPAQPEAEKVEVLEVVADEPASAAAEPAPAAERPSRRQRTPRREETDAAASSEATTQAPATEASEPVAEPAASDVDEFELAARLFSFTGEVFIQAPAAATEPTEAEEAPVDAEKPAVSHVASRKPRAPRGAGFKRMAAASFSVGVMGIVGLMTVSMTTPAEAVAAASGTGIAMSVVAPGGGTTITEVDADEIQAYVAPAGVEAETLDRAGSYDTATVAELASQAGIKNFSNLFHNDPNAAIQWPFAVGVTMSYGFGMRSGRMHEGIDFTPGAGSPVQAIADGTVRVASESGGAYGVHVIIDHVIDGQLVSSHYAHMQYGSLQVVPGQKVTVGTVIGRTGNTGRSYGAHTHFEILMNGTTPIDPMPWLREHAGG